MTTEHPNEGRFDKWFRSEVGAAFAFGAVLVSVFIYLTAPVNVLKTDNALIQQQLSQIKNNDLTHIELEIASINTRLDEYSKQQIIQGQQLTQILTIIKK